MQPANAMAGWTYIMCNRRMGTLYVGVTGDLMSRVYQHRQGEGSSFCEEHGITRLVLAEPFPRIQEAIAREKAIERWRREWKIRLIEATDPEWRDLWIDLNR